MISTNRNITDGKLALVERVMLDDDGSVLDFDWMAHDDAYQFACKIAEKNKRNGKMVTTEPVFKHFNAASLSAAFEYADQNIERWVEELKAEVSKPKIAIAGSQDVNRFKLNGH
jgi:hypothetical protein